MTEYLVVYDYGMGGVWGFARAASVREVSELLPELQVIGEKPEWITPDIEDEMRSNSSFVVNDPGSYPEWLRTLISERNA